MNDLVVVVLAAGKGTRMKSNLTKVCHKVGDKTMIEHVTNTASQLSHQIIVVVSKENLHDIKSVVKDNIRLKIQTEQLGTGHAVVSTLDSFKNKDLLVLLGDVPLITAETLKKALYCSSSTDVIAYDAVIIGFHDENSENKFGRIIRENNRVKKIVEYLDCTPEERQITLCNSGMLSIKSTYVPLLYEISNNNKKGEYYLTDIVEIMVKRGLTVGCLEVDKNECLGVNSPDELSQINFLFSSKKE